MSVHLVHHLLIHAFETITKINQENILLPGIIVDVESTFHCQSMGNISKTTVTWVLVMRCRKGRYIF